MRRVAILLFTVFTVAACRPPDHPVAQRTLSDEDFATAKDSFDALSPRRRVAERPILEMYLIQHAERSLRENHPEEAFEFFRQLCGLYEPAEIREVAERGPTRLIELAARIETAFRKRGAHKEVLTALAVERSLAPKDAAIAERYKTVVEWMSSDDEQQERLLEDLEQAVHTWPTPFLVAELERLYANSKIDAEGIDSLLQRRRPRSMREWMNAARPATAYNVARLELRLSRYDEAAAQVQKLENHPGYDATLKRLLDRVLASDGATSDWVALASYFASQDRDVAARICKDATVKFPKSAEAFLCAGEYAIGMSRLALAVQDLERAIELDPSQRETWEELARLYQEKLFLTVSGEENPNVGELENQLKKVEAFHLKARQRFQMPLKRSLAGAVFEVGRGFFNAGRSQEALRYLGRSVTIEASPGALELMGQIRLKKSDFRAARELYQRALLVPKEGAVEQLWWRAKLRRQIADAMEGMGDNAAADETRQQALADWHLLLGQALTPEAQVEARLEHARVLYSTGERDAALHEFQEAIDAGPDRGSTYADVIAFLVPRGELEEALDAYHRALGRNEVTDYLKVYCSLWILDLARRAGQPEDPIASAYLKASNGGKWYDDLARWATGRAPDSTIVDRANTPGRKAESAFYRAMRAAAEGNAQKAQSLWRQVISTEMMAFFEFDMAAYYLKLGRAPTHPVLNSKAPKEHTPPTAPGSI
jgi:tetratricopeptide (TPR) repeat protein